MESSSFCARRLMLVPIGFLATIHAAAAFQSHVVTRKSRHAAIARSSDAIHEHRGDLHRPLKAQKRDMQAVLDWATDNGVQFQNGCHVMPSSSSSLSIETTTPLQQGDRESHVNNLVKPSGADAAAAAGTAIANSMTNKNGEHDDDDDDDDWCVVCRNSLQIGSVALTVPRSIVLSSKTIERQIGTEILLPAFDCLESAKCSNLQGQFVLFLQLLKEMEAKEDSLWHPWLQSLPTSFDTALFMDEVEMELLAPFAFALADLQKRHYTIFRESLQKMKATNHDDGTATDANNTGDHGGYLSKATSQDENLLKLAYSIVFSRSWQREGCDEDGCSDICPLGDMFNHATPSNVVARYSSDECIDFVISEPIAGSERNPQPLHLSYGFPTNPYRFLCIFGFVDESQPEIFIQVLFANPTPEHVALGCNERTEMVFRASDGLVADAVWDCVLYAILEQIPEHQTAFWKACRDNDAQMRARFHERYRLEVCMTLRKHVARSCSEFATLVQRGAQIMNGPTFVAAQHPILPKIQQQNEFLLRSFSKVTALVDTLIQEELAKRRTAEGGAGKQQSSGA